MLYPGQNNHSHSPIPSGQVPLAAVLIQLRFQLDQVPTDPAISMAIIESLSSFYAGQHPRTTSSQPLIGTVHQGQHEIGWAPFILGKWHPAWCQAQQRFLTWTRSRRNALRWATAVIIHLTLVAWDMWDHRNRILHGPSGPLQLHLRQQLLDQLRQEYITGAASLLPQDHFLFRLTQSERSSQSTATLQQWLASVTQARNMAADILRRRQHTLQHQHAMFCNWLQQNP